MIYRAVWADGREALIRAPDEEQARLRSMVWRRDNDTMFDNDVPPNPTLVEATASKGPAGILMASWSPGVVTE